MAINSGSFMGNAGGGGNALAEAISRRGMDPGILNQVGGAAPTAPERGLPQPVTSTTPSALPSQQPQTELPAQGQPGGLPNAESTIIIKALDSRLKKLGELQTMGIQV